MKIQVLIILASILASCTKEKSTSGFIPKSGFMEQPGIYTSKSAIIIIKKYDDGSLTFGVADRKYKIIYQQSIFSSFSDNLYWFLYKDEKENIWFYSSDIQESKVLIKDSLTNTYTVHDFCKENIKLPLIIPRNHTFCF
ncbi:MAG: hypothetical protein ABI576_05090 [Flavobacterium sp.]